jgi:cytochrome oxidase Cu insertion factor (SCO1/SenC/PrrC family)
MDRMRINFSKNKKIALSTILVASLVGLLIFMKVIPVKAHRTVDPNFLNSKKGNFAFIFFGYPGCSVTCSVTLKSLANVYQKAQKKYGKNQVQVNFVNLLPNVSINIVHRYVKKFHSSFVGVTIPKKKLEETLTDIGVVFARGDEKTLLHAEYTFLLEKKSSKWVIHRTYLGEPLLEKQLLKVLDSIIKKE